MAVIKYQIEAVNRREFKEENRTLAYAWQYEEIYNPHRQGRLLTREEAQEIIREKGLVLVHQMGGCKIWDQPDEPLWQEYNGTYGTNGTEEK